MPLVLAGTVGAIIIRIGFWGILCYNHNKAGTAKCQARATEIQQTEMEPFHILNETHSSKALESLR